MSKRDVYLVHATAPNSPDTEELYDAFLRFEDAWRHFEGAVATYCGVGMNAKFCETPEEFEYATVTNPGTGARVTLVYLIREQ